MAAADMPPPSYNEATQRADWLRIAAPYFPPSYHARLCLVSRRFFQLFTPLLWNDPVTIVRYLRQDGEDDLEWYCDFVDRLDDVRLSVREMVRILDLRGAGVDVDEFSLDGGRRGITDTLGCLAVKLPKLRCILLDGHAEVNLNALGYNKAGPGVEPPRLMSMGGCQAKIEASFFTSLYFRELIYLDVSGIPEIGTTKALLQTLCPEFLPKLGILKIQGHGMGDSAAVVLLKSFKKQLWSLDLSRNTLTDGVFDAIFSTFPAGNLRDISGSHKTRADVEGSLKDLHNIDEGPETLFVEESQWSATFSHPDRYLVDAPNYTNPQGFLVTSRLNGATKVENDSADWAKRLFSSPQVHPPGLHQHDPRICEGKGGITHLRLNENNITAAGISKLLLLSSGHLQHFECDSMTFQLPAKTLPSSFPSGTKVSGLLGAAHLFRPLLSPNLQVLRIHHSLITQLLTIETDHLSDRVPTMISLWAAETYLLPAASQTYPQPFIPDMNPRLHFLILTKLPRYSAGPLFQKLIHFLKLLSLQQRAIHSSSASRTHHCPQSLPGLRSLTLEFEHDPSQELEELDLSTSTWLATANYPSRSPVLQDPFPTNLPASSPLDRIFGDATFLTRRLHGRDISVWIGPDPNSDPPALSPSNPNLKEDPAPNASPSPVSPKSNNLALKAYPLLARSPPLQTHIQPASPSHIAAGVPPGVFIFGTAWDATLAAAVPTSMPKPRREDLAGMVDVIAGIKRFRAWSRERFGRWEERRKMGEGVGGKEEEWHWFWAGEVKVVSKRAEEYYTDSKLWR